jgi:anti-anti-sigma factor
MPTRLDISHHRDGDIVTIVVTGELDHVSGGPLSDLLVESQDEGTSNVVLDLRTLEFMDSTGLGIMLDADRRATAQGGVFTVIPGPAASHILAATGLTDRLRLGSAPSEGRAHTDGTVSTDEQAGELDRRFPASKDAVGESRRAFDAAFPDLSDNVRDDARIIVSELVTNGIRHGAGDNGWVRLVVRRREHLIRIEVTDSNGSANRPHIPERDPDRTSGWGLMLVERLAAKWGVSMDGVTTVWCELAVA